MAEKQQTDQTVPVLYLDGKRASEKETLRIIGRRGEKTDPNDRATKPIQTMSRPFRILR